MFQFVVDPTTCQLTYTWPHLYTHSVALELAEHGLQFKAIMIFCLIPVTVCVFLKKYIFQIV